MSDTATRPSFGARFARALGGIVLALLNATLILVIVAAIVGLMLVGRVRTLATDVADDVTQAALASAGLDPAQALSQIHDLSEEVAGLRTAIAQRGTDIDQRVEALSARLDTVQETIEALRARKIALTDAVIARAADAASDAMSRTATDVLERIQACKAPAAGSG